MVNNEVGMPYVADAKVEGEVVKHGKERKLLYTIIDKRRNSVRDKVIVNHILR